MVNRDDIIRMAREAGLIHFVDSEMHCTGVTDEPLITAEAERNDDRLVEILGPFAALVAAAEREACAEACAEICDHLMDTAVTKEMQIAYGNAADAIRERT